MGENGDQFADESDELGETRIDPSSSPALGAVDGPGAPPESLDSTTLDPTIVDRGAPPGPGSELGETTVDSGELDGVGSSFFQLPPDLDERLEIVGELKRGSQAVPLVVRDRVSGEYRILKVFDGIPEEEYELTLAMVASSASEHLVRVHAFGTSGTRFWEELEYCRDGSLADLIASSAGPLEAARITEIVSEIARALTHLHGLSAPDGSGQMIHRDIKPANILIRGAEPLDLVLCDFGLSRVIDSTMVMGSKSGTDLYAAPEVWAGAIGTPRDWWALGMIVVELATGRHPFRLSDGAEMNRNDVQYAMTTRPIDVSGIQDERIQLLARGLLTRDDTKRWGAREVAEWLDGGTPTVHEHDGRVDPYHKEEVIPFLFPDPATGQLVEYDDPIALAEAMGRNWDLAAAILHGGSEHRRDNKALIDFLGSIPLDPVHRELAEEQLKGSFEEIHRRLYIFLRVLAPGLTPVYRSRSVDAEGLAELALNAVNGDGVASEIVHSLFDDSPLKFERQFGGEGDLEAMRIEREWDLAWRETQPKVTSLVGELGGDRVDQGATENALRSALALSLLITANAAYRETLVDRVRTGLKTEASEVLSWSSIANGAVSGK